MTKKDYKKWTKMIRSIDEISHAYQGFTVSELYMEGIIKLLKSNSNFSEEKFRQEINYE